MKSSSNKANVPKAPSTNINFKQGSCSTNLTVNYKFDYYVKDVTIDLAKTQYDIVHAKALINKILDLYMAAKYDDIIPLITANNYDLCNYVAAGLKLAKLYTPLHTVYTKYFLSTYITDNSLDTKALLNYTTTNRVKGVAHSLLKSKVLGYYPNAWTDLKIEQGTYIAHSGYINKTVLASVNRFAQFNSLLRKIPRLVIAGGHLISPFISNQKTLADIDLFMYGQENPEATIQQILDAFELDKTKVYATRNALTFRAKQKGDNQIIHEYQIILRNYTTLDEILHGFDFACCQFAYDGYHFYSTHAGALALTHNVTMVEPITWYYSFEKRIKKYFYRGFNLYFPNLDISQMNMPLDMVYALNRHGNYISQYMANNVYEYGFDLVKYGYEHNDYLKKVVDYMKNYDWSGWNKLAANQNLDKDQYQKIIIKLAVELKAKFDLTLSLNSFKKQYFKPFDLVKLNIVNLFKKPKYASLKLKHFKFNKIAPFNKLDFSQAKQDVGKVMEVLCLDTLKDRLAKIQERYDTILSNIEYNQQAEDDHFKDRMAVSNYYDNYFRHYYAALEQQFKYSNKYVVSSISYVRQSRDNGTRKLEYGVTSDYFNHSRVNYGDHYSIENYNLYSMKSIADGKFGYLIACLTPKQVKNFKLDDRFIVPLDYYEAMSEINATVIEAHKSLKLEIQTVDQGTVIAFGKDPLRGKSDQEWFGEPVYVKY